MLKGLAVTSAVSIAYSYVAVVAVLASDLLMVIDKY